MMFKSISLPRTASSPSVMSASCPSVQVPPAPVARSTVCCSSQESAKFTAAARMQAAMANARVARLPR